MENMMSSWVFFVLHYLPDLEPGLCDIDISSKKSFLQDFLPKFLALRGNMLDKVILQEKFKKFDSYWTPKILGEINNSHVKIFKAKGEFEWHRHDNEDEFFLVVQGQLFIKLKDKEIVLNEGEFFIVPRGVDHMPYATEEAHILLFEPKGVVNTGETFSEKTVENPEWI